MAAAVLVIGFVSQTGAQGPQLFGVVSGQVTSPSGSPVPDVLVTARTIPAPGQPMSASTILNSSKTDAIGRYRMENLPAGRYFILAGTTYFPGAPTKDRATVVVIDPGSTREAIDIRQPSGFKISGRLAIAPAIAHSSPLMIGLYYSREDLPAAVMMETALRPDLTFEFLNVPSGLTQVRSSIGLPVGNSLASVRVDGRDVTGVELGAGTQGVRLFGKVIRDSGQNVPLPKLVVMMRGSPDYRTPVNADGTFEFLRINAMALRGALEVRPTDASGLPIITGTAWGTAVADPGDQDVTGFEIPIAFGVEVSGHVSMETGSSLPAASPAGSALLTIEASASPNGRPLRIAQALTPIGGSFGFPLPAGNYQIDVRNVPEGYKIKSITGGGRDLLASRYEIAAGQPARDIQITLTPSGLRNGTISGRILNADGTPAITATVGALAVENTAGPVGVGGEPCSRGNDPSTIWLGALSSNAQTGSDGKYKLEGVPPGRYKIVVGVGLPFPGQVLPGGTCGVTRILSMAMYYPGTKDLATATTVNVDSAAAVDLEFRMASPTSASPLFNVKGRIISPAPLNTMGYAYSNELRVTLGPPTSAATTAIGRGAAVVPCTRQTTLLGLPGADGSFEVRNVPPGSYIACVIIDGGDYFRIVNGPITVNVVDRNVVDLTFTIR